MAEVTLPYALNLLKERPRPPFQASTSQEIAGEGRQEEGCPKSREEESRQGGKRKKKA